MYLSQLTLSNFRNYKQLTLPLGSGLFLFHGENAQGKTNLLEAVGMLATATSFHASNDREVVGWLAPEHIAHLNGLVQRNQDEVRIEIAVADPTPPQFEAVSSVTLPTNMPRKRYKVNGVPRRTMDVIGQVKVVLFAPTDLHLVDGSPEERRRFLDQALCQLYPRYSQALVKYRKVVTQRSALLKQVRENQESPGMLDYLDEQLTLLAQLITYERQRMLQALNEAANGFQQSISGGREQLQIAYRPSLKLDESWGLSELQPQYLRQLREVRRKEIQQGVCSLGPHRDDLEFIVNGVNMLTYGSRGQQRTAALAAKLAELGYMRKSTGDEPILLLDDVFSELDHFRREYLLCQVAKHQQVLLTATDLTGFPSSIVEQAHIYQVRNGDITADR
ncbi:DNA replication/repair protein RecF [Tengunoibacter tsumagoiensis]|uniref:DNA replication and repair protein RecF n=1 Tax=Tengunoibacter tsumagoiensis TaxID=2014871 RepID=A0A401ZU50_9CHLR|nr:DNA replication/repair protein RecF [Tengunoibacter tsumagoiensis]GCE10294.1 DNA replication and repair protein RecF [Tengunoibacter tsumagoiensis]